MKFNPPTHSNQQPKPRDVQPFVNKIQKIKFSDLFTSKPPSSRPASRSNHKVVSREMIDDGDDSDPEPPDRINSLLGAEFYKQYHWVSKKHSQFHSSEFKLMISSMGFQASLIEDKFPEWFHFLFPSDDIDRKNWTLNINGSELVSISRAVRNGNLSFLNQDTSLEICPICDRVMSHKYLVYMRFFVWKEDYTGSDIIKWTSGDLKACYIHWRQKQAFSTRNRNPWKLDSFASRKPKYQTLKTVRSSSPLELERAVLPAEFV